MASKSQAEIAQLDVWMSDHCKDTLMEELEKYLDEQCLMESELEKVSLLAYLTIKIILD